MRFRFNFSNVSLTYLLNDTETASGWLRQISRLTTSSLKRNELNHKHGFATPAEIDHHVNRIEELSNILGFEFNGTSPEALNQLHTNFPEFFKANVDKSLVPYAHELNLTIHWIEHESYNQQIFNVDFNHDASAWGRKQKFPLDEMSNFTTDFAFGTLHLHYIYIGRHYYEMCLANDLVSPPKHFRPQHEFNATCGLVFGEVPPSCDPYDYFVRRGGKDFFGYDFNDPLMAKGFFKLGQLEGYETLAERDDLRTKLNTSELLSWEAV